MEIPILKIRVGETVHPLIRASRQRSWESGSGFRTRASSSASSSGGSPDAGLQSASARIRQAARRNHLRGIRAVSVFYSPVKAMMPHQGDLPFAIRQGLFTGNLALRQGYV